MRLQPDVCLIVTSFCDKCLIYIVKNISCVDNRYVHRIEKYLQRLDKCTKARGEKGDAN